MATAVSAGYLADGIPICAQYNVNRSNIRPTSRPPFTAAAAAASVGNGCDADLP